MNKTIFIFLLLLSQIVFSQVNTEKYRNLGDSTGFFGFIKLDASVQTGNKDLQELGSEFQIDYRKNNSVILLILKGDYGWNNGTQFSNEALAHLRYIKGFTSNIKAEAFTQINYDKSRLLLFRALGGLGARLKLFGNDHSSLWFGSAYMLEFERYRKSRIVINKTKITSHRWSNYLSYNLELKTNVNFSSVIYYQPRFNLWSDIRVLSENNLFVSLSEYFTLTTSFELRYDSRPPETVKKVDTKTKIGFIYVF